tara:strand:- start:406 stop:1065 length:660 start_codon:yes stop_codon:yes gene_type:complete
MENRRMKINIYQKLHKAACEAGGVAKGKKVQGMHFNPLLHDEVQKVAMEALLNNGLYPVCTYENQMTDSFILVTCNMKIHDVEDPKQFVEVSGCSAMGNLDKFGTGNGMSYAKKYAYLNALHLKTGLDNDDGLKAKPFQANKIPQSSGPKHGSQATHVSKDVQEIMSDIQGCKNIYEYRRVKKEVDPYIKTALKNKSPKLYEEISDLLETRGDELNRRT